MPRERRLLRHDELLITCEHGGNRIPPRYRAAFASAARALASHQGYDPGALALAREFARRLAAPLVYSTIAAHLLTILFCWAVVTRLRSQPFFESLGWNWAGRSPLYWLLIALAVFVGIIAANAIFIKILPQKKTPFDELIQSGLQVRIAIALLELARR